MVALSPVSHRASALATPRSATGAEADGGFAQAFAALGGGDDDDMPPALPQRQGESGDGKDLPATAADPAAPATLDPRLLWLPVGLSPAAPVVSANDVAPPTPQPIVMTRVGQAEPLVTPALTPALTVALTTADAAPDSTKGTKALDQIASGDAALQTKLTDLFHASDRVATPPAVAATIPAPLPPPVQAAPAVASAIHSEVAALGLDPVVRDDRKTAADPVASPTTLTTEVALQNAVLPTGDTRHVPLDLRGDTGLQKMIDHIETLRDGADANDTRIRLVPDALGTVDVAVQRSGDAIHVHFTAENPATRNLLTEAQPRLAELAEQRGVSIAGSSVETGTGGGSGGGQPPHRVPAPITNVSVSTPSEAAGDDARLA